MAQFKDYTTGNMMKKSLFVSHREWYDLKESQIKQVIKEYTNTTVQIFRRENKNFGKVTFHLESCSRKALRDFQINRFYVRYWKDSDEDMCRGTETTRVNDPSRNVSVNAGNKADPKAGSMARSKCSKGNSRLRKVCAQPDSKVGTQSDFKVYAHPGSKFCQHHSKVVAQPSSKEKESLKEAEKGSKPNTSGLPASATRSCISEMLPATESRQRIYKEASDRSPDLKSNELPLASGDVTTKEPEVAVNKLDSGSGFSEEEFAPSLPFCGKRKSVVPTLNCEDVTSTKSNQSLTPIADFPKGSQPGKDKRYDIRNPISNQKSDTSCQNCTGPNMTNKKSFDDRSTLQDHNDGGLKCRSRLQPSLEPELKESVSKKEVFPCSKELMVYLTHHFNEPDFQNLWEMLKPVEVYLHGNELMVRGMPRDIKEATKNVFNHPLVHGIHFEFFHLSMKGDSQKKSERMSAEYPDTVLLHANDGSCKHLLYCRSLTQLQEAKKFIKVIIKKVIIGLCVIR